MLNTDNLNTIVNLILAGKSYSEIQHYTNLSRSTIQNYVKALNKPSSNVYNPKLYLKLREIQKQIIANGQVEGGKISKRTIIMSIEKLNKIADWMLANDKTLAEAEDYFGIPTSTIYEDFEKKLDNNRINKIHELYLDHTNKTYNRTTIDNLKKQVKDLKYKMGTICECIDYLNIKELAQILDCEENDILDIINNQIAKYYPEQYERIRQILGNRNELSIKIR